MRQWFKSRAAVMFGCGLSVGLLVGVGMLVGSIAALKSQPQTGLQFPLQKLQAVATHGGESFAMATGPISDGMEGVFFLDFLTGDLQGYVMSSRGVMGGAFAHNIVQDLGVEKGKKPQFLLATGTASFRGNTQMAGCIVYVCDANTGRFVAYGLPWSRQAEAVAAAQRNRMVLLGAGKVREAVADQ